MLAMVFQTMDMSSLVIVSLDDETPTGLRKGLLEIQVLSVNWVQKFLL